MTAERLLKLVEAAPTATCRATAPDDSAPDSTNQCRKIHTGCIDEGLWKAIAAIKSQFKQQQLRFYITNNMCEEPQLKVGWPHSRRRSALAWQSQVTWLYFAASGQIETLGMDMCRAPRLLNAYTSATLSIPLGDPKDAAA